MMDVPEAWEFPKPGTEDEMIATKAAESQEDPRPSTEQGANASGTSAEPPAEGRAGKPAPPFPASQLGTYLHAQHYHFVAPNLPFATAAAEGLIDPTRYGPLPWGYPWPGPYPGSKTGYGPLPGEPRGVDEEIAAAACAYLFSQGPHRRAFVQKVMAIVCLQLLFAALVATLFYVCAPLKAVVYEHPWVWFLCWAVTFVCLVTLAYNERARRTQPTNYVTLCVFTLSFALLVGIGTSFFHTPLLIEALGLTAVTVACLFIIATSISFDFTQAGGFLWTCGFVLVLCILFGTFVEDNVFWLVISGAGAILFAMYLLYDLQKLMGGRYLTIHPDDYVYAAVQVYLDIVTLFMLLLSFVSLNGAAGAAAAPAAVE